MLDLFIFSLLSPVIGSHLTGSSTWFHHTSFYLSDRKFHNSSKPRISQVFVLDFLKFSSQHKWWNRIEQNRIEDFLLSHNGDIAVFQQHTPWKWPLCKEADVAHEVDCIWLRCCVIQSDVCGEEENLRWRSFLPWACLSPVLEELPRASTEWCQGGRRVFRF